MQPRSVWPQVDEELLCRYYQSDWVWWPGFALARQAASLSSWKHEIDLPYSVVSTEGWMQQVMKDGYFPDSFHIYTNGTMSTAACEHARALYWGGSLEEGLLFGLNSGTGNITPILHRLNN